MRIIQSLSETSLGRALLAYFYDLPRWTLANALFAVALLPAALSLISGLTAALPLATLPLVPVLAGMINITAQQVAENAPRSRDAFTYPVTLTTVFVVWAVAAVSLTLALNGVSVMMVFIIGIALLSALMVGVFGIFLPSQMKITSRLVWRNALVLAVSNPITGFGLLVLAGVGIWSIWISKGALILIVPSLWVIMAAFTVDDRIVAFRSIHP
jgi:hypothetical protein